MQASCVKNTKLPPILDTHFPPLRYMLTVHDLTNTQLNRPRQQSNKISQKVAQYTIPWGYLLRSLYSHDGLKLCFPSQLYKEAHVLAYASSRYKADEKVQSALDAKLSREGGMGPGRCLSATLQYVKIMLIAQEM